METIKTQIVFYVERIDNMMDLIRQKPQKFSVIRKNLPVITDNLPIKTSGFTRYTVIFVYNFGTFSK